MTSLANRLQDLTAWLWRPSSASPELGRRQYAFDAAIAALATGTGISYATEHFGEFDIVTPFPFLADTSGSWPGPVAAAVTAGACLFWRRRFPLTVLWIVTAVAMLTPYFNPRFTMYPIMFAVYGAVMYSPFRWATFATLPVAILAQNRFEDLDLPAIPNKYIPLAILIPLAFVANGLRVWKERTEEERIRMSVLEGRRAVELRDAAEAERSRIARELHDVITHNVSMMVIQAGAARKVLDNSPEQARQAMSTVESGGREALRELRHVMGLLTVDADPDAEPAALAPQPRLDRMSGLIDRVRAAGLPVTVTGAGPAQPLPPGVDLAAYRVVQEALTNTMKHATGATATVHIMHSPQWLRIEVTDTGGVPGPDAAGAGRGHLGLRQRLDVYGGTLVTEPITGGGYRVEAVIPVEAS